MRALLPCGIMLISMIGTSQSPLPSQAHSSIFSQSAEMEILIDQAAKEPMEALQQAKQAERTKRAEFARKANRFVELWEKLANEMQNGKADAKLMHRVSAAFHDLEKSDGWRK